MATAYHTVGQREQSDLLDGLARELDHIRQRVSDIVANKTTQDLKAAQESSQFMISALLDRK